MSDIKQTPKAHDWIVEAALVFFALFLKIATLNRGLVIFDVGEVLFYIDKILGDGQAGIDYVVNSYGFGRYAFFAFLFGVFGKSLTVLNLLWALVQTASVWVAFRLAKKVMPSWCALLALVPFVLVPGPVHKSFFVFFTLAGCLCAISYLSKQSARRLIGYAVLAALAFLARPDLGVILCVGFAAALAFAQMQNRDLPYVRHGLTVFAPILIIAAITVVVLAIRGALPMVAEQIFDELGKNTSIREPGYPRLLSLFNGATFSFGTAFFYGLLSVLGGALIYLVLELRKEKTINAPLSILFVFALLGANQLRIKPDFSHMLQSAPLLYILAVAVVFGSVKRVRDVSGIYKTLGIFALGISLFAFLLTPILHASLNHPSDPYTGSATNRWGRTQTLFAGNATIYLAPHEKQIVGGVLEFLDQNSSGCDRIFVPTNQPMLYFLADKKDVTGYPSVVFYAGSDEKQNQVIERLQARPPAYVIFVDDTIEGDYLRLENAAPKVKAYLDKEFEVDTVIGNVEILRMKGTEGGAHGCPHPR